MFCFFILHTNPSSLSLPFSWLPRPLFQSHIPHPLRWAKDSPRESRKSVYYTEAESSPSLLFQDWTRYATIGNGFKNACSRTQEKSQRHWQGRPHTDKLGVIFWSAAFSKPQSCPSMTHIIQRNQSYSDKDRVPIPSNLFKQFYFLVTKHSYIWANGGPFLFKPPHAGYSTFLWI